MTKAEIAKLLRDKPSWERDIKLREYQNQFILRSGVSRRLFDCLFRRCTNKKPVVERRIELMDKKK